MRYFEGGSVPAPGHLLNAYPIYIRRVLLKCQYPSTDGFRRPSGAPTWRVARPVPMMRPMAEITLNEHLRRIGRKRWKGKSQAQKSATAQHASRAYWDSLSKEERSAEMKRRAKKRKRRK
jgi:hypothetical protein